MNNSKLLRALEPPAKRSLSKPFALSTITASPILPVALVVIYYIFIRALEAAGFTQQALSIGLGGLMFFIGCWYYNVIGWFFHTDRDNQPTEMITTGLALWWIPVVTGTLRLSREILPAGISSELPFNGAIVLLRSPVEWHHIFYGAAPWMFVIVPCLLGIMTVARGTYLLFQHATGTPIPEAYLKPRKPEWYELKLMVDDLTQLSEDHAKQLAELKAERDAIGYALAQAKTEVSNLTRTASDLSIERRGLDEELRSLKTKHNSLTVDLCASQETVQVLRKAYEEMAAKVRMLETVKNAAKADQGSVVEPVAHPHSDGLSGKFTPPIKINPQQAQAKLAALAVQTTSPPEAMKETQPVDQDAIAELEDARSAEQFIAANPVLTAGPAVDVVPTLETSPDDAAPEPRDSGAAVSRQENQPIEVAAVLHELGNADPQDQDHDAASGDRGDNVESSGSDPALEADAAPQPPSKAEIEAETLRKRKILEDELRATLKRERMTRA